MADKLHNGKEKYRMKTRALKKIGRKVLVGILAVACVCSLGSIPMKAKAAEMTPTEKIWKEVVEEYGLKQEETTLVYDTDGLGRTTQVPQAVKSEQVNEDGTIEATYYVPYVLDENEELVNSFERVQGRSFSGNITWVSVIFSYTAMYEVKPSIYYFEYFRPTGLSVSYRISDTNKTPSVTQFSCRYDIRCNLFASPECINTEIPPIAYSDRHFLVEVATGTPEPHRTYYAYFTDFPNGYLARCEGYGAQGGWVILDFRYQDSKGNLKSTSDRREINKP